MHIKSKEIEELFHIERYDSTLSSFTFTWSAQKPELVS